jgi:hypothetical protein
VTEVEIALAALEVGQRWISHERGGGCCKFAENLTFQIVLCRDRDTRAQPLNRGGVDGLGLLDY